MLVDLMSAASKVGLEVHLDKTCFLTNAFEGSSVAETTTHLKVNGHAIKVISGDQSLKYLGRSISASGFHETEVKHCIRCGWAKFH